MIDEGVDCWWNGMGKKWKGGVVFLGGTRLPSLGTRRIPIKRRYSSLKFADTMRAFVRLYEI